MKEYTLFIVPSVNGKQLLNKLLGYRREGHRPTDMYIVHRGQAHFRLTAVTRSNGQNLPCRRHGGVGAQGYE